MHQDIKRIKTISDGELATKLQGLAGDLRLTEAEILLYLTEMAERKLFAKAGYSSLFAYCMGELKFSEGTTCRRLAAARVVARFPEALALVVNGELHITALAMLEKHLSESNVADVLRRASGCTKTQLEWLIAELAPKADIRDGVRKTPTLALDRDIGPGIEHQTVAPRISDKTVAVIRPIAPERVMIKCSASGEVAAKIKRAKDLLAHKFPGGELEHILEAALDALLEKVAPECKEARKVKREKKQKEECGAKKATKPATPTRGRYVPAAVKAEALRESGGQCTYVSPEGRRCEERRALQFDHIQPYALGGSSNADNIRCYCRTHNDYAARQTFGSHEPWRAS